MKLIVGLGNPGKEYTNTRHNAGFRFVDALAGHPEITPAGESLKFSLNKKFEAELTEISANGQKIILVKPRTFMNLSGRAVARIMSFYRIDVNDLIVVADDKDLPLGTIRVRYQGSSAGQKGLQNIIDLLKTDAFSRIRLGIAKLESDNVKFDPPEGEQETSEFVLSEFEKREMPILNKAINETIEYLLPYLGKNDRIADHTIHVI